MFLIFDPQSAYHVFTNSDPTDDGFKAQVFKGVTLHIPENLADWPDGAACPDPVLAVSQSNANDFRVFKHDTEVQPAGYRVVGKNYHVASSYAAFVRATQLGNPPIGTHRFALHNAWDRVGPTLLSNGGFEKPSASLKRRLLREYLDGEKNVTARKFWHSLKDQEKTIHLLDAFPDDDEFIE